MHRQTTALASGILLLAVLFGAFGAHSLKRIVTDEAITVWQTGISYQFYHGFALLFLALAHAYVDSRKYRLIRTLFTVGIVLFSGSLYLLVLSEPFGIQYIKPVLGPITPIGGLLFIAGWGIMLFTSLTKAKA